jgi:hypothetical protein
MGEYTKMKVPILAFLNMRGDGDLVGFEECMLVHKRVEWYGS